MILGKDYYECPVCRIIHSDVDFPYTRCQICNDTICFHCLATDTKDNICDKCYENETTKQLNNTQK